MSCAAFNVGDLGIFSALQLTLWPSRLEFRELTEKALTAFGTEEQAIGLRALGHDFVRYLQFEFSALESTHYPRLLGFQITHSVLSKCTDTGRNNEKRSVRILTDKPNGPILRGYGDSDQPQEITAMFSHLSVEGWERLVIKLGWNQVICAKPTQRDRFLSFRRCRDETSRSSVLDVDNYRVLFAAGGSAAVFMFFRSHVDMLKNPSPRSG